jgi:aminotransferase
MYLLLSDEAYEKFVFDKGKHVSFGSLNGMHEYTLTLQTFSKSFAMPGYRIGYVAGHHELIHEMSKIHIYTTLAPSTANQYGAWKALQLPPTHVEKMRESYADRRALILKLLKQTPSLHVEKEPEGAFYVFPRIVNGMTSQQYAHALLEKAKVLVVPGNEFGTKGQGFVRMSYATDKEQIKAAFERMWEKGF